MGWSFGMGGVGGLQDLVLEEYKLLNVITFTCPDSKLLRGQKAN